MGETRIRNEKYLKAFGENLKKIRESKGLTQEQLAENTGCVSVTSISRLENGHLDSAISTLVEIARAMGVPPKKLFDF
jgi:transcriptional regulator with XRE-family HTH domain